MSENNQIEILITEIENDIKIIMENKTYERDDISSFLRKSLLNVYERTLTILNIDGVDSAVTKIIGPNNQNLKSAATNFLSYASNSSYMVTLVQQIAAYSNAIDNILSVYTNHSPIPEKNIDLKSFRDTLQTINNEKELYISKNNEEKNTLLLSIETLNKERADIIKENTKLISDQEKSFQKIVDDLNKISKEQQDEINRVLDVAKRGVHSENYIKTSKNYKTTSIIWNLIGTLFTVGSAMLYFILLKSNSLELSDNLIINLITKFLLTSPSLSIGVYSLRQANKYEKLSVKLRFIGNDLSTIDSFIKDTGNTEEIKTHMAYKYYGSIYEDSHDNSNGLFITPEMILNLTNEQYTLIQTIFKTNNTKNK